MSAPAAPADITAARPLVGPFATPPLPEELRPSPATLGLVRGQVQALLMASPSYHALPSEDRRKLAHDLVRISAYSAECMRDVCWQSERLGQTPVVRRSEPAAVSLATVARAQEAGKFEPAAASQIERVTQKTLRAIAFPTFVADLVRGTFNAILQTSIQQMEAFMRLVSNVGKTVDQFMDDNISDNQARDWLAQSYPDHIRIHQGQAVARDGAGERKPPDFQRDLNLDTEVSLDDSAIEETLVPAARRKLAESRLQLLSTLVLMGIDRIIVTGGKIRATMGFHIDATDRAHEESATDLDTRVAAAGGVNMGWWSASASMSLTYVRSTRADSDTALNVDADLTGEVELHFQSAPLPVERFAKPDALGKIQQNTAAPEANAPPRNPFSAPPSPGGEVGKYSSPRSRHTERQKPSLRSIGEPPPPARLPEKPLAPDQLSKNRPKDEVDAENKAKAEKAKAEKEKKAEEKAEPKKEGENP